MVAGLQQPDAGSITLNGVSVASLPPYRRDVGMVFQNYALFPHMTVRRNVAFPLEMRGTPTAEIARLVDEALALVKLPDHGERLPKQLSGGQQQRVALARAMVYRPALLLMDEPLGALDRKLREQLQLEIKRVHRERSISVLYVTHDQEEALTMADRIVVMNQGAIDQVGTPQEIYRHPTTAFVADFVGSMNFLPGTFLAPDKVKVGGLTFDCPAQDGLAPAQKVNLCIRPEDVRVRDLPAGIANRVPIEVADLDFVGAFCRALLKVRGAPEVTMTADFSSNLIRDLGVRLGSHLDVALPPDRLRVFAA
jgi:ABC-type Fe3+/spermidine/putrescine transport system ATPase subunit